MDRAIIYPAAIPMTEDLLTVQRSVMSAIGYLIQATLGTSTAADGLACGPVAPPSMTLEIGPGSLTSFTTVDATPFSTLAASANPLMKMGIASGYTPLNFVAPSGAGTSVDYLIQAAMEETDAAPIVFEYYNAANSAQPYAGPGGSGGAQASVRQQIVALQIKAGAPAVSGSQVAPAADAGWVALYIVNIPAGTTALTAANISVANGAPFIGLKIPGLDAAVSALQAASAAQGPALAAETARAEAEEAALNAAIGAETLRAEAAEANLAAVIAAETARAEAAEASLNGAIGSEATARNNEVAAEATARNNADVAEAQARSNGDAAVSASIPGAIVAAFSGSLGGNGWRRSPDGFIEQWGTGETPSGNVNITFPTTFPGACFDVFCSEGNSAGWIVGGTLNPTNHGPTNISTSGFTLVSITTLSSGGTQYAAGAGYYWRAIGV